MSERYLPAGILELMERGEVYPDVFIHAVFPAPTGDKRIWTGEGNYTDENDVTWQGIGTLMNIQTIPETTDTMAQGITCTFAAIAPEEVDALIGGDYPGGDVTIWIGFRNMVTKEIVVDWENPTWKGILDTDDEDRGRNSSKLTIYVEHKMLDILRKKEHRYTHRDQKFLFPGTVDTGLDKMEKIQKLTVPWGKTQK